MKMKNSIVFANDSNSIKELTAGARSLGGKVVLVTSSSETGCADETIRYEGVSIACILKNVVDAMQGSDVIICEASRDGRLVAGYAAVRLGVSPMCDSASVKFADDSVETQRLVFGGSAVKTERCGYPAVLVVSAGAFEASDEANEAKASPLSVEKSAAIEQLGTRALEVSSVSLAASKKIVGIGRGLLSADNIPYAEKLAAKLGAEVGCSRPVAEEEHWYPKERYIGVSGCMLKPSFYMAIGISGQIQHMVGVNQANVIFAINKDEKAPIIEQADYTLVGDAVQLLPVLADLL